MMLDLSDDPPRPVPGGDLIQDAAIADQRGVARPAAGPDEEVPDGPLQHGIGREVDGLRYVPSLQRLIEGREAKGRVGADDCSSDGTGDIIRRYAVRHPGLVRPLWTEWNLGIVPNFLRSWQACRG